MGLVPCPACRTTISVEAATCPKCGKPFHQGELASHLEAVNAAKADLKVILNKTSTPAERALGLIVGVIGTVIGVVFCITGVGVICGLPILLVGVTLLTSNLSKSK